MFEAYFDESGQGQASKVFAVGGFVGPAEEWAIFSEDWEAIMRPTGVAAYHAADCEGGYGEFANWTSEECNALTISLVDCLLRRKIFSVGFGAIVEDFKEVIPTTPETLWNDLYEQLFEITLIQAVIQMAERAPGQRLAIICDRHNDFEAIRKRVFCSLADEPEWNHRHKQESITYASRKSFLPLQAADKAAYETHKLYMNQLYDPKRPARMAMYRFFDLPFYTAYCGKHSFLELRNQKERRIGSLEQWEQQ